MSNPSKHPCTSGPHGTPCCRIRPGEAFDINLDCHLCHKFTHNLDYNLAWGGNGEVIPIRADSVPVVDTFTNRYRQEQEKLRYGSRTRLEKPCRYLGEPTGEVHDCIFCGGGKNIPVRSCAVHGRCTYEKRLAYRDADRTIIQVQFCLLCADYQPKT